jgi:lipopolysaccharide transport system permease protein
LPLLTAVTVALALGLGRRSGAQFIRDIGQMVLEAWSCSGSPPSSTWSTSFRCVRGWLALNPLIPIIAGYQDALLYNRAPDPGPAGSCLLAAILLLLALLLFRKASPEMVDQL